MALRMRKDIKKSSYYVWFLGAQESKGLRGAEYIVPVVKSLVQRERDVEPFKVTLQVSHKGLKIIQNILPAIANNPAGGKSGKNSKPEVVKHFIPHHAITCVLQDEDIVACILLLYNPVTKCPVHVHAYRCDSVETAEILRGQLQTLIERPENQKKLSEIETRLRAKGLLLSPRGGVGIGGGSQPIAVVGNPVPRRVVNGGGSDGRSTSTRESESSGGSSSERLSGVGGHQERIASLYDSLAAELREKLGTGGGSISSDNKPTTRQPILLPPRDYDTVHRQKGNLTAIDLRRCLNENIVGVNVKKTAAGGPRTPGSSGGSSGIGSDHAPSPDQQDRESDQRYLDNQSSSDEDWTEQPSEDSLFLVQPGRSSCSWRSPGTDLSLPRARRVPSNNTTTSSQQQGHQPPPPSQDDLSRRRRQRSPSPSPSPASPRDRFKDAKEKFLLLEKERLEEQARLERRRTASNNSNNNNNNNNNTEPPISPAPGRGYSWGRGRGRGSEDDLEDRHNRFFSPPAGDFDEEVADDDDDTEDVFEYPERLRARRNNNNNNNMNNKNNLARRDSLGISGSGSNGGGRRPTPAVMEETPDDIPPTRRHQVYRGTPRGGDRKPHHQYSASPDRRPRYDEFNGPNPASQDRRPRYEDFNGPNSEMRQYSASPDRRPRYEDFNGPNSEVQQYAGSPDRRPRYEDFNAPNPEVQQYQDRRPRYEEFNGPTPDRRITSTPQSSSSRDRYLSPNPRPAPRGVPQMEERYHPAARSGQQFPEEIPLERYRSPVRQPQPAPRHRMPEREDGSESHRQFPKRRSMFDALEEERRRNSNELAKEFKRRSYQELPERERYPGLDRESARAHAHAHAQSSSGSAAAGYRHSYAEGPIHHDMLHRTNSSVSSGRVGIAAIHPY